MAVSPRKVVVERYFDGFRGGDHDSGATEHRFAEALARLDDVLRKT